MLSDSNSSSDDDQNPKPDATSIDQSLDAIENQLASISMSQSVSEFESESEHGMHEEETTELNHQDFRNGSLSEIDQLSLHNSVPEEVSRSEKDVDEPKASSSRLWTNAVEEEEVEAPSSPSSSGYAGERGSSSSASGILEVNNDGEIDAVRNDGEFDEVSDSQAPWVPGKRHGDEVS